MNDIFFKNGDTHPLTKEQIINIVNGGYFKLNEDDLHSFYYIKEASKYSDNLLKCTIDAIYHIKDTAGEERFVFVFNTIEYIPIYDILNDTLYIPITKDDYINIKNELKNKI
jgi:hypothetical protein